MRVLVLGGTGSIGRHVVREAIDAGHDVVALVRSTARASAVLPDEAELIAGDLITGEGIDAAADGAEAVLSTLDGDAQRVDFEGMHRVLAVLQGRRVHVVLMTAIGIANVGAKSHMLDWKRRGERLVRASGQDFTIARPGWFDMQTADHQRLHLFQGERRWSLQPDVGVIGRRQIARVLVAALTSPNAKGKTFDLVAEIGPAQPDIDTLFAQLQADADDSTDCIWDPDNMPLADEPADVLDALADVAPRLRD